MKTILGHSDEIDVDLAADEIIEACRARLDGDVPKGAMLFSSVGYEHSRLLERIAEEWPEMPLIGGAPTASSRRRSASATTRSC